MTATAVLLLVLKRLIAATAVAQAVPYAGFLDFWNSKAQVTEKN